MRTIDADELKNTFDWVEVCNLSKKEIKDIIDNAPTVNIPIKGVEHEAYIENSFTIDELRKWLFRIAFNNSNNHFGDYCLEIVRRLNGFMNFVKDLRKGRIG